MAWYDRLIRRDEPATQPQISDALLQALFNNETITREKALMLPAVSSAVDFITNAIACMPVKLYKQKNGKVEEQDKDYRVKLLNGDTGDTLDGWQLKKAVIEDYLLGKGGYVYIERKRNDVTGLFYVSEDNITIMKNVDPIHKAYRIEVNGKQYEPYDFIKVLRNTKDGASGTGLTVEVSKALETAYQTLIYQLDLVKSGGSKKGFLKANRKLGQDEINTLKTAWRNLYSTAGSDNVVTLNNGIEFQEASKTSVEMQLNESKKTLGEEIASIFHISGNFELTFKLAIYPIVKAFETALNRDLLLEKEKKNYYFEFDVKEIVRASLKERYEAYQMAKSTGFITTNEIRKAENLEYIEGMDVINVGLGAVLYDINTHQYYAPNSGTTASINADNMIETQQPGQAPMPVEQTEERAIAVDYDNTLTKDGEIDPEAIEKIKELQKKTKIILWTARKGRLLQEAIDACKAHGLIFDEIADNKPDAELFIDDKATTIEGVK